MTDRAGARHCSRCSQSIKRADLVVFNGTKLFHHGCFVETVASVAGRRAGQRRWARCRKRGSAQSTTSMDRQRDAHTLNVALPSRHLRPMCSYGPMPSRLAPILLKGTC